MGWICAVKLIVSGAGDRADTGSDSVGAVFLFRGKQKVIPQNKRNNIVFIAINLFLLRMKIAGINV